MQSRFQFLRIALRSLRRDRTASLVAIASLALAIGGNSTVFSLVQAVEFPRLIYPDASRLVFLESAHVPRGVVGLPISAPDAENLAAVSRTLQGVAIAADQSSIAGEGTARRRWSGRRVTSAFFPTFGVPPALGRWIDASDREGVIVLSDAMWRSLGADASIVGTSLRLDGGLVTVIGVMPARFDADADFWTPLSTLAGFARDDRQLSVFARLAPGATLAAADRELRAISERLARDYPATNDGWTTFPIALTRLHGRDSRGAFLLLQAAVLFVLLIACANIANILLARGARRSQEMAVRLSLGATRRRLIGQLLAESLVLAAVGGAIGIALALWGIRAARLVGGFPEVIEPAPNLLVLAFTVVVSGLTGILCGIVPAVRASAADPREALSATARGAIGRSRRRLRNGLVAVQVASAVMLGTGGALLMQSFVNRQRVDLGFDPNRSVQASLAFDYSRYDDLRVVTAQLDNVLGALTSRGDVASAGAITWALPTAAGAERPIVDVATGAVLNPATRRAVEAVTPGYFAAMGIDLIAGRVFTAADAAGSAPVVVVNDHLARQLWPDRSAIGASLRLGDDNAAPVVSVAGVVRSIRRSAMHDAVVARVYVPFAQYPNRQVSLVARARTDTGSLGNAMRAAAAGVDPLLMVERVRTTAADLAAFVAPLRMMTWLLTAFAVAAALLAAVGVFGSMSYSVTERQRELAVRAALGADVRSLLALVYREGATTAIAGVVPGAILAIATARLLGSLLFGVEPADPWTLAGVAVVMLAIALTACLQPARRAATADPMTILRRD